MGRREGIDKNFPQGSGYCDDAVIKKACAELFFASGSHEELAYLEVGGAS
jgi:hypothetical protein